ncbi:Lsr2 family DNA-binding protein [Streptomyces sp. NPDC001443]
MSEATAHETDAVRQAWERITGWLEHHAPEVFAALGGPGSPAAIGDAEERMGLQLPRELRQLLLMNDVTAGRRPPAGATLVTLGCEVDLPGGGLLLGLVDIERVYFAMMDTQMGVSGHPDCLVWRREWVPITAETDGFHGNYLDTGTGCVGSWCEGEIPTEEDYPSLAAFLQVAADGLEGVTSSDSGKVRGRRASVPAATAASEPTPDDEAIRLWARANGMRVNDGGRIPTSIREAYEKATEGVVGAGPTPGNG